MEAAFGRFIWGRWAFLMLAEVSWDLYIKNLCTYSIIQYTILLFSMHSCTYTCFALYLAALLLEL